MNFLKIFDPPSPKETARIKQTLFVGNQQPHPVKLLIEPWCEEFQLQPGERVAIDFEALSLGEIELKFTTEGVTVYGYAGSVFEVRRLKN